MRLLVIRTSAMGDVALTVPVLAGMRKQHPDIEIVLLTRKSFLPFFSSIEGLRVFTPDFTGKHKGLDGTIRLYFDLQRTVKPHKIIDLHDVLRSKILRFLFRLSGVPAYFIDKGRREKRELISGKKKALLKHTVERYSDVFTRCGYPVEPERVRSLISPTLLVESMESLIEPGLLNIGIAPFSRHKLKMWPQDYMLKLLALISESRRCKLFLFCGKEEAEMAGAYLNSFPGIVNMAGTDLAGELALMSKLDLMISMDSSNMHMAALCGTKVISIWGGTDPMAGFAPWMQPDNYAIRIPVEELDCRPCTIYGKGKTHNGFACMNRLTPEVVYARMKALKVI